MMSTHGGVTIRFFSIEKNGSILCEDAHFFRHWDGYPSGMLRDIFPFFKMVMEGKIPLNINEGSNGEEVKKAVKLLSDWLIYFGYLREKENYNITGINVVNPKFSAFEPMRNDNIISVEFYYVISLYMENNKLTGDIFVWEDGRPPSETYFSGYDDVINMDYYSYVKNEIELDQELLFYNINLNNFEFQKLRKEHADKFKP
jgi:hypothetical protein